MNLNKINSIYMKIVEFTVFKKQRIYLKDWRFTLNLNKNKSLVKILTQDIQHR